MNGQLSAPPLKTCLLGSRVAALFDSKIRLSTRTEPRGPEMQCSPRIKKVDPSNPSLSKISIFDKPDVFTSAPWCVGNEVTGKGFGTHVATEVVELMLEMGSANKDDFIIKNHASGEHSPEIRLIVFDGLKQ